MRLVYFVKATLKGMLSNGAVTIIYFILFPVLVAGFMGFVQNTAHDNPLKLKGVKVQVVDNDNSEMSKKLVEFLENDEVKEIVTLADSKPEVELVINKGYENNLLSLKKDNLILNKKEEGRTATVNTLKVILDKYHQSMYVALSNGSQEELERIAGATIIENITIDEVKTNNAYEKTSASMIGFIITMLIFTSIQGGYADISVNLDKRVKAAPITRIKYLLFDSISLLIYCFIIMLAYVLFFRILGIGFKGSLLSLLGLISVGSIMIVSISKCISTLFGAKIGKIIGTIVFMLPVIAGEMFMGEGNIIKMLTPTHYLNNAFTLYNLNGNINGAEKWILSILIMSIILFGMAIIKEGVNRGKRKCA